MTLVFQTLAALYGGFVFSTSLLWFAYLGVMAMMAARDAGRIPDEVYRVCKVCAAVGLVFDVLYNIIIGTLFFLDPPRDWTLTYRLIRYKKQGSGVRYKMAMFICKNLLDPFAPDGCHCKTD